MKTVKELSDAIMAEFVERLLSPKESKIKRTKEYNRKFTATGIRTAYLLEEINKIVAEYEMVGYWQREPHASESASKIAELIEKLEKERLI